MGKMEYILNLLEDEENLSKDNIEFLLSLNAQEVEPLRSKADAMRKDHHGNRVHLRGIIEFSNYCKNNCLYCGLRKDNLKINRYRMQPEEIVERTHEGMEAGFKTIVLQSGEDPWYTADKMTEIIKSIKSRGDIAITLSLGERTEDEYLAFKEAGADRYLLKHETADYHLYKKLNPGMSFKSRLKSLLLLKKLGFQVGSGAMVGLPGQTFEVLARDILLLKRLEVEMAGIGPFIPSRGTPLGSENPGSVDLTLKVLAVARIVLPKVHLPSTTSMFTLDPASRIRSLDWGANVIMPNITPAKYAGNYEIYPNKRRLDGEPKDILKIVKDELESNGREIADDAGHGYLS